MRFINRKTIKTTGIILAVLVMLAAGSLAAYRIIKYQGVAEEYDLNTEIDHPFLIIATQQSTFKDEVVKRIISNLEKYNIRIKVTDVTKLPRLEDTDWDGMLVMTTVESGQFQQDSDLFLQQNVINYPKIALVYTADSLAELYKDSNLDVITSASKLSNVNECVDSAVKSCKKILGLND